MPTISRGRALAYLAAVAIVLVVGGRFLIGSDRSQPAPEPVQTLSALELEQADAVAASSQQHVVVHVAGAVRRPGLYELPSASRIDDAIRAAGGARPRAALELVNLAAPVSDGQQIVVPLRGAGSSGAATGSVGSALDPAGPVHLNSATLEELDGLPGVGPVTAQRILEYRTEHGPFTAVDELDAIPGIGPARLEQLRELVTV